MSRGGARPGAGRPRKVPGRYSPPVVTDGVKFQSALDFAMALINDPNTPLDAKIRLAVAVMPFQHARLTEKLASKKGKTAEAAKKASQGLFAVPAGPKLVMSNAE